MIDLNTLSEAIKAQQQIAPQFINIYLTFTVQDKK